MAATIVNTELIAMEIQHAHRNPTSIWVADDASDFGKKLRKIMITT